MGHASSKTPQTLSSALLLLAFLATGCGSSQGFTPLVGAYQAIESAPAPSANSGSSTADPSPVSPTPLPTPTYLVEAAPLWEAVDQGSRAWTLAAFANVDANDASLLAGASDMNLFCPNYSGLSRNEKLNFWVYLASAIAKYESNESPISRMVESTLGTDRVTGEPVYSEGLMQLSYQDELSYTFCAFNWAADSLLSPTSLNKTILNPGINLACGLGILNHQIERYGKISIASGAYWSTLEPSGTYSKVTNIEALTTALPFCQD